MLHCIRNCSLERISSIKCPYTVVEWIQVILSKNTENGSNFIFDSVATLQVVLDLGQLVNFEKKYNKQNCRAFGGGSEN